MGKKSKANNLGRALIRDRFNHGNRRTVDNNSMVNIFAFRLLRFTKKKKQQLSMIPLFLFFEASYN